MSEIKRHETWGEAALAGLPHLLFAVAMELPSLAREWLSARIHWRIPALTFFALVAVVLIFGWRRRWPRWAASWIGYGLVMALLTLLYSTRFADAILLAWIPLVVVTCLWLTGRNRSSGLLAALPVVPMLWSFFALDEAYPLVEAPLFIGAGLLTALAAAATVRLGRERMGVWLALAANLLVGLSVTYAGIYYSRMPALLVFLPPEPMALAVSASFAFHLLVSSMLVIGPLWGWTLWERGRRLIARGV